MKNEGYIKLHRKILKSDMWIELDSKTKILALTLMMLANSDMGIANVSGFEIMIEPGQTLTSLGHLAEKCGSDFTPSTIRNSLKKLEKFAFLTVSSNKRYTLVEILKYDKYQNISGVDNIAKENQIAEKVIKYLNLRTGKHFRSNSKAAARYINARLNEGHAIDDFYKVIDYKVQEWTGTKFEAYLAPTTLFAPSHFETYLNAAPNITFDSDSDPYRLALFFQQFIKRIDEKYFIRNMQSAALDFDRLLKRRHSSNEVYYTMKKMFESNNSWMIKKYKDTKKFCLEYEEIYIDLKIDFKDGD